MLKIAFANPTIPGQNTLVLTVAAGKKLGAHGVKVDKKLGGAIKRAMDVGSFTGAAEQTLVLAAPSKTRLTQVILVGIGEPAKADALVFQRAGGAASNAIGLKESQAAVIVDDFASVTMDEGAAAAAFGFGARLRSYRFDKYHTKMKPEQKPHLKTLTLMSDAAAAARQAYAALDKVADGVFLTRDVVSEPPNVIYPETLAAVCKGLTEFGIKVEILDEKKMKALGMGALLGVSQGSINQARLVTMTWTGDAAAKDKRPIALIGKGVTFDSGGLSLKPPGGMEDMKWDMAGAGAVIGAMKAIAGRKAKANVVGVVGLVENMPSGTAQRPGDVVTSMSGQTIEVLNTDAEGRLVLCDAMWYTQEQFNPRCMIDLATLTGAIIVSLGHEHAGLFGNDDALCDAVTTAGRAVGEPLWRMPLSDYYDKDINSPIADMKNIGSKGEAGSITAAQFLQRFVKKGTPWVHLDIAGMAWQGRDKPTCPKGATAFGVRLLNEFIGG